MNRRGWLGGRAWDTGNANHDICVWLVDDVTDVNSEVERRCLSRANLLLSLSLRDDQTCRSRVARHAVVDVHCDGVVVDATSG